MEHAPPKERCPGCDWKGRTPEQHNRPKHTCEEHSPEKAALRVLRAHGTNCENRQQLHARIMTACDKKNDNAARKLLIKALKGSFATAADRELYEKLKTPMELRHGATAAERSATNRAREFGARVPLAEAKAARERDAARRSRLPSEEATALKLTKEFKRATEATYTNVLQLLDAFRECACIFATARAAADKKIGGALELCLVAEASMGAQLIVEGGFGFVTEALWKKAEKMIEDAEAADAESLKLEAQQERDTAAEEARAAARRRPARKATKVEKEPLKALTGLPGTFACAYASKCGARRRVFMLGADRAALNDALKKKDTWGKGDGISAEVFANAAEQDLGFQATGRAIMLPTDFSSREYDDLKPTLLTKGSKLRMFKCVARLGSGRYLILMLRKDGRRPMMVVTTRGLLADLLIGVAPPPITEADADARLRSFSAIEKSLAAHRDYLTTATRKLGLLRSLVVASGLTAEELAPALVKMVASLRGCGETLALNTPPFGGEVSEDDDEGAPVLSDDAADKRAFGLLKATGDFAANALPIVLRGAQIK